MSIILRAGLFERVSTEEQAKFGYSIQTQIDALEEYCEVNKMKIVDHYCDEGVSGGKPYTKRPETKRLIEDVKAGKIDIILFTRLDRWFRNVPEYFKVQEILDKHGVQWKAIWEDYDTTTANGRMAITIFLAIAQNEREKGSERICSVFENKRKNKESFFGPNATPAGYMEEKDENGITRLVKDPILEPAFQHFWDIAVKYENLSKAAKSTNLEYGIKRGRHKWIELAKKEIYTGDYKGVENYCPAYVSREDWEKLMGRGFIKSTKNNRIYLFTGLIKCPKCGKRLSSRSVKQTRKNGEIKEYYHYKCPGRDSRTCGNKHSIAQNKAETWLLDNLSRLVQDEIAKVEIARTKPKPKPKVNISKLKEKLRRLSVAYMAGNMTDEEYLHEQNELKTVIKKAELEKPFDLGEKDITELKKLLETDFRSIYNALDNEDKRRFWRTLLKEIHVEENNVVSVDFN